MTMAREGWLAQALGEHGVVRSQPVSDWSGPVPLPPEVARFYREVGPDEVTIDAHGNPFYLPSLVKLWDHQVGYRYHSNGGELAGWDPEWLVVADQGGDPFIVDCSSGRVLHAFHGQGGWDPQPLFLDIFEMAGSLALLGAVVRDAGNELTDESCALRPEPVDRARALLAEYIGSEHTAVAILARLEWEAGK